MVRVDQKAYSDLEQEFEAQVDADNEDIKRNVERLLGIYFPVPQPTRLADYVFIAMEPSFNWAKDLEDAKKKIECGFRNFGPMEPFKLNDPLHLFRKAIETFLLKGNETYYMTDLSKGAMLVDVARALDPKDRYKRWYPLLLKELGIASKRDAPVFAVGKTVHDFLEQRDFTGKTGRQLGRVLHYSAQAAGARKIAPEISPQLYQKFRSAPFIDGKSVDDLGISETLKHLIFTYKMQFVQIRKTQRTAK